MKNRFLVRACLSTMSLAALATMSAAVLADATSDPPRSRVLPRAAAATAGAPVQPPPATFKAAPAGIPALPVANGPVPPAVAKLPVARNTAGPGAGPAATDALQAPALARCATGFGKTGENVNPQTGVLSSFECTTPVITCPKNPVLPSASLDVQIISENPEGTVKRVRYVCTYYPYIP